MPKGKCLFNKSFMENEEYKLWLKPGKTVYSARCSVCDTEFSVEWSCSGAIKSHDKGKEHKEKMKHFDNSNKGLSPLFFRRLPTAPSSTSVSSSSTTPSSTKTAATTSASSTSSCITSSSSQYTSTVIDQLLAQQVSTTRAEIIWVLRMVKNHNSFRSCLGLGEDLKAMFQNNDVVTKFTLSKTKSAYFVTHDISPWVKSKLQTEITDSCFFSVSFNESLNQALQNNQMDIQIRYWCDIR